jgi:hypothetical protein
LSLSFNYFPKTTEMKKLTFLLLFAVNASFAQTDAGDFQNFNPRFEVFELPGSASGNSVQGVVQDSTGFLWFASQAGAAPLRRAELRHLPTRPA